MFVLSRAYDSFFSNFYRFFTNGLIHASRFAVNSLNLGILYTESIYFVVVKCIRSFAASRGPDSGSSLEILFEVLL